MTSVVASFLLVAGSGAYGQNSGGEGVDNVLERLEKQILSDEADGFSHPGLKPDPETDSLEDQTASVGGVTPARKKSKGKDDGAPDFSGVLQQVKNLEKSIEQLSSDVHQYKQAAVVASKDNTYVYIEAAVVDAAKNNLKSIRVKIDGFTVYQVRDTAGLWLPAAAIPLYSGPLTAGSHRIEVEAAVGEVQSPGLAVTGALYKGVEKSFEIQIPLSSANKKYVLSIGPAADKNDAGDAGVTLKETM
jgi:hypothetical protein